MKADAVARLMSISSDFLFVNCLDMFNLKL